jgi:hypothetical protein
MSSVLLSSRAVRPALWNAVRYRGDYAAGSRSEWEIPSEILEVTKAYLDRWPKLPGAPAERATP